MVHIKETAVGISYLDLSLHITQAIEKIIHVVDFYKTPWEWTDESNYKDI